MQQTPMVRLASVSSGFHARVIAARLGSEGIVTQLRGGVDGPYPMGDVHVYVGEEDLDDAQELLMVDEVESAFEDCGF
ncbi:MAG: putative signal transducing protein [Acidimicrobiales bacterium]